MIQALKMAAPEDEENQVRSPQPSWHEEPIIFECEGCRLMGIAAIPVKPVETGMVIVVGGPQYRAGSHRQFTLLARQLAQEGIASFRFDYRGMGDSEGEMRNFEVVDADIRAAIDAFLKHVPSVSKIVLWGLCDAASAALFYGHTDLRIAGLILLNPWVHTEQGLARVRLKRYYLTRLAQASLWRKLFSGSFEFGHSWSCFIRSAKIAITKSDNTAVSRQSDVCRSCADYTDRMLNGLIQFSGKVLLILSGNDLTAQEFQEILFANDSWRKACQGESISRRLLSDANHTFSSREWRNIVAVWTRQWLEKHFANPGQKQL